MNISLPSTIAALASAPGKAGVAVIRISGSHAAEALAALGVSLPTPRHAHLCTLRHPDSGDAIDKGLVLYFAAPHSFTGEDVVELHTHGSRSVVSDMLEALCSLPYVRLAEPGEFTRRAFLNGKLDLTAAEGLADLIDAQTPAQRRQALRQMSGAMATTYKGWREAVVEALALIESCIDFVDEDLPEDVLANARQNIAALSGSIRDTLSQPPVGERIREGIYIAILGAPNVGKSSLLNALAGSDVAIVSDTPGTTRDIVEVTLRLGGYAVTLADTAGIRESSDAIESEGIRRALARAEQADLQLLMMDSTDPAKSAAALVPLLHTQRPALLLLNKSDVSLTEDISLPPALGVLEGVAISTKQPGRIAGLVARLSAYIEDVMPEYSAPIITRLRHRQLLENTLGHLESSQNPALPLEIACEELRPAAQEIGKIMGIIHVEELLDTIFSRFCIGK